MNISASIVSNDKGGVITSAPICFMKKESLSHLMRNREKNEAEVSYSELLFDLIYVFAVTQLSHFLLHHLTLTGIIESVILWFGIWLVWQHTIWVTNWFNPNTRNIRLFLFVMMIVSLFMTSSLPHAFDEKAWLFVLCYVSIQLGRTLYVLLLVGRNHSLTDNYIRIFVWMCISSVFWIAGLFAEEYGRIILWATAVLVDYISPMFRFSLPILGHSESSRDWTIDGNLLLERCKLFVIIAFGETILMTGVSLSDLDVWTAEKIMAALVSFASSLAMWWIYFDVSSEAASQKIRKVTDPGSLGLKYNYIHVIMIGAIIICAVGDELVVNDPSAPINPITLYVMLYGPIIYLLANMAFKWTTCRSLAKSHLWGVALLLLMIPVSFFVNIFVTDTIVLLVFILVAVIEYYKPGRMEEDKARIED